MTKRRRLPASLSSQALLNAWQNSRDAHQSTAGSPGIDRVQAADFRENIEGQILRIRHDIQRGRYKPNSLRPAFISKGTGKSDRVIAIPTVSDRLVQRAILGHLGGDCRFPKPSPISYGFVRGRRLQDAQKDAARLRTAHPWCLQVDICSFFDTIDRRLIKRLLAKYVRSTVILNLIIDFVNTEIKAPNKEFEKRIQSLGIVKGRGLRQGMPISPALSNLFLNEFDKKISKIGLKCIRYADDIAIFCDSRKQCNEAEEIINRLLIDVGLKIKQSKTKICAPSEVCEFLGVDIKRFDGQEYRVCAPTRKIPSIEADMSASFSLSYCISNKQTLADVSRWLDSFIIGHTSSLKGVDGLSDFVGRLEAAKERTIQGLLVEILGRKSFNELNAQKLAVLGVNRF